jgi:hypothetical protein
MKKCAKTMKMSCQNAVPKCANVTTLSNTKLSLPYLWGLEFPIIATEAGKIAFYYPTINPTFNPTANILPATYTTREPMPPLIGNNAFQFNSDIHTMKL